VILRVLRDAIDLLRAIGVDVRLGEMFGEKEYPYLVICLFNVHMVDGEPTIEEE
jgi:hypothetical protein